MPELIVAEFDPGFAGLYDFSFIALEGGNGVAVIAEVLDAFFGIVAAVLALGGGVGREKY